MDNVRPEICVYGSTPMNNLALSLTGALTCQKTTPALSRQPLESEETSQSAVPLPLSDKISYNVPFKCASGELSLFSVEYSRALGFTGLGRFHWFLALSCGYVFLAAGLQNSLIAYILPSVHCDLRINSSQMGLLNAVFLAGGICSGFIWGIIADLVGRKIVLVYGMFIDGCLTLCLSLTQDYITFLILRFFNGFILGGPAALVCTYLGEFFPAHIRTTVVCYIGIFWSLSWVIMPIMAWGIIPIQWYFNWNGFVFNSWRMLVAVTAIPELTSAALLTMFPESPRFLLDQGMSIEAVDILSKIYAINKQLRPEDFLVKSLKRNDKPYKKGVAAKNWKSCVTGLFRQTKQLVVSPTYTTTALFTVLFFTNMFGYYGLGLWLPELFQRMSTALELFPDSPISICNTNFFTQNITAEEPISCVPSAIEKSVFVKSIVIGTVSLLGNLIAGALVRRTRRRTLPVVLMGASCLCVLLIYYTSSMTLEVIIASVFQLTVGTANLVYNSQVVDVFPSNISGVGVSLGILSGRLGAMVSNLIFGYFLDISCTIPIFVVAFVLFVGTIASFFIPNDPYNEKKTSPRNKENEVSSIST